MIMKFLDWTHKLDEEAPGAGVAMAIFVGTIFCCTGLMFLVLAYDFITREDE